MVHFHFATVLHVIFLGGSVVSHLSDALRYGGGEAAVDAAVQLGPPTQAETIQYLLQTVGRIKDFAKDSRRVVEEKHNFEEDRLQASLPKAESQSTKVALKRSIFGNTASLLETHRIYDNMVNFASSMEEFLQAAALKHPVCEQCGSHANCAVTTLGAQCVCNEGYIGDGQQCVAPAAFKPHRLLLQVSGTRETQADDMHVTILGKGHIAVVFRDKSEGHVGRAIIGKFQHGDMVVMAPPASFTLLQGKAYSPVVAGTGDHHMVVAWRDQQSGGLCWLRGASMGMGGIPGGGQHLRWGEPVNFCQSQSHKMAILPLPGSRVVVFFADKVKATNGLPEMAGGSSLLLNVGNFGAITTLGTSRFADYPVCRLEVTRLTPRTFILAGRAAQAMDDMDPSIQTNQEAMALLGEMSGDAILFEPNALNLEPQAGNIWARGVSLIAPNTFAYAYQRGEDRQIMMAIAQINETTRQMEVVLKPSTIKDGFSPYVSMLSTPYSASDPHTLTYYQGKSASMVNVCSWDPVKLALSRCEDFPWLQGKAQSVSGVHLGGGRSFMVFTSESGVPHYGIFGLSKK